MIIHHPSRTESPRVYKIQRILFMFSYQIDHHLPVHCSQLKFWLISVKGVFSKNSVKRPIRESKRRIRTRFSTIFTLEKLQNKQRYWEILPFQLLVLYTGADNPLLDQLASEISKLIIEQGWAKLLNDLICEKLTIMVSAQIYPNQ